MSGNSLWNNNEVVLVEPSNPWEMVKATMQDIYHVLMAIKKEEVWAQNELAHFALSEQYLHNHTISGEFEYSAHTDGQWIVDKIKQYKPILNKSEESFVVEM